MYPPHFPIQLSSSLPNMSLLTSCLFLKKRNVNNPLSPISVAHMCKGVGPCTRTWESFQRPHPQEEWLILFPQKLSTDNNSSVREGAVLMVGTTSALSSSCDSMSCPEDGMSQTFSPSCSSHIHSTSSSKMFSEPCGRVGREGDIYVLLRLSVQSLILSTSTSYVCLHWLLPTTSFD